MKRDQQFENGAVSAFGGQKTACCVPARAKSAPELVIMSCSLSLVRWFWLLDAIYGFSRECFAVVVDPSLPGNALRRNGTELLKCVLTPGLVDSRNGRCRLQMKSRTGKLVQNGLFKSFDATIKV